MSCENCEESAYVIDRLAKLLAEIAVIVNGVEPHDTSWSYHDLPKKVRALKQAQQPAAAVPEGYALVPVDVLRFLEGSGRLDGLWFGERHPTEPGRYWWRKHLPPVTPAMLAAAERKGGVMDWNKTESLLAVKNDSPLIAIAAPPPPPSFEFRGPNSEPMVTIRPTGEVELAPGLDISEASRVFWQGLADAFPAWKASVIAAARKGES